MRKRLWCLGIVCIAFASGAATTKPAAQPATRQAKPDFFAMSLDDFRATREAQRPVPWQGIDDELMSAAILHETNRHRVENNLPPLRHMPRVTEAAMMHADDMITGDFFGHVNEQDPNKREVIDRVKRLGLNPMFVGENLAKQFGVKYEARRRVYDVTRKGEPGISYSPNGPPIPAYSYADLAQELVQRWMDSPAHRTNVLSPHAKFLGAACRPGTTEDDDRFRKFTCVQVFFTPMPER